MPRRPRPYVRDLVRDVRGATAVEFALILGAMLFLTIGVINLALLIYSLAGLQSAAQNTARWAAIQAAANAGALPAATLVQDHGVEVFRGAAIGAAFAAEAAPCGIRVTATGAFLLITGLASPTIPLSVTACQPGG